MICCILNCLSSELPDCFFVVDISICSLIENMTQTQAMII